MVWEYSYISSTVRQHHDIEPLPNGNVLFLAWELKTADEIRAAGGDPFVHKNGELWVEHIVEVKRTGPQVGKIVWEYKYAPTSKNVQRANNHVFRIHRVPPDDPALKQIL